MAGFLFARTADPRRRRHHYRDDRDKTDGDEDTREPVPIPRQPAEPATRGRKPASGTIEGERIWGAAAPIG